MSKHTVKPSNRTNEKKVVERVTFQYWLATPATDRVIKTQKEFAERYDVHMVTLSEWKKEPGFMDEVEKIRRKKLDEALSDIYKALIEKAKAGDANLLPFAFKLAGRFTEKQEIEQVTREEKTKSLSNEELCDMLADQLAKSDSLADKGVSKEALKGELLELLK